MAAISASFAYHPSDSHPGMSNWSGMCKWSEFRAQVQANMLQLGWDTEDEAADFVEAYKDALKKVKKKKAKQKAKQPKDKEPKTKKTKKRLRTPEQAWAHKKAQRSRQDPAQRKETKRRQRENYKAKQKAKQAEQQAALQDLLAELDKGQE